METLKTILATILICLFIISINEASATNYTFRKTIWGMSMAQVKASESLSLFNEDVNTLVSVKKITIGSLKVRVIYNFTNEKLTSGLYLLREIHLSAHKYISNYETLKELLYKKYGKAQEDGIIWHNDLYRDTQSALDMALSLGHVSYCAAWIIGNTQLGIILVSNNFKISCAISYVGRSFKKMVTESNNKESLENL